MTKNERAIKLLEMLSSDEFQKFTSSEFDDIIYYILEVLKEEQWHITNDDKPKSSKHCIYSEGFLGTHYGYYLKPKDKWYKDYTCKEEIDTPKLWREMPDTPEDYLLGETCG